MASSSSSSVSRSNSRFKHCPGDSPVCLGMVEYDCCGSQGLLKELEQEGGGDRKRKKTFFAQELEEKGFVSFFSVQLR